MVTGEIEGGLGDRAFASPGAPAQPGVGRARDEALRGEDDELPGRLSKCAFENFRRSESPTTPTATLVLHRSHHSLHAPIHSGGHTWPPTPKSRKRRRTACSHCDTCRTRHVPIEPLEARYLCWAAVGELVDAGLPRCLGICILSLYKFEVGVEDLTPTQGLLWAVTPREVTLEVFEGVCRTRHERRRGGCQRKRLRESCHSLCRHRNKEAAKYPNCHARSGFGTSSSTNLVPRSW